MEQYNSMKIDQLRVLAKERGASSVTTKKKAELVAFLELADKAVAIETAPKAKPAPPKQKAEKPTAEKKQPAMKPPKEKTVIKKTEPENPSRDSVVEKNLQLTKKPAEIVESTSTDEQKIDSPEPEQDNGRHRTDTKEVTGVLELCDDGYGFLRGDNYLTSSDDVYVSPTQIRRFRLKTGDEIVGIARLQREGERFCALLYVTTVNGDPPGHAIRRVPFENLTPVYPDMRMHLEVGQQEYATRLIDLIAPIGMGQRGMIVSPPKSGKTTLLKNIAKSISANHKDVKLIVLLIDERPEEVTDMQRSIDGEVIYSTFDEVPDHHIKVAEMVLERAMRLVEHNHNVVILMDSITRLARAYNLTIPPTGRTLSGGLDPGALHRPKRFFGAARNIENGGSLTILATALVETGSRMDDVIYEEFKGTGNMEVHLDRKLQEKRIFPAIDLAKSGTRKEELLLAPEELEAMYSIRKAMDSRPVTDVMETLINQLVSVKTNEEFVRRINKIFSR